MVRRPNSTWSFFNSYKSAAQNVPRVSLVTEMLKNQDLARFVASLLPTAVKKGLTHHVLLAFNAATVHDFIKRSKTINEGTVAYLLPALLEPLHQKPKKLSKEAVVSLDIGFFFQAHSYHYFSSSEVIFFLPRFRESVKCRLQP